MQLHAIPMPKPIRIATPKIAAVKVSRIPTGGLKVQHVMHQAPTKTFVFQNPQKALTHLNRIQSSEWREPDRNEAPAITRDLNLGPTS
jgi:hypothetical protein